MTHHRATRTGVITSQAQGLTSELHDGLTDQKKRTVVSAGFISASLPFIDEGKFAILGSLVAARGDKYLALRK
jgi:hypothetical protein